MRKLTLKLDNLKVDSFATGAEGRNGTVRGNDTMETEWCTGYGECPVSRKCQTPYDTCFGSCQCTVGCETLNCG